MSKPWTLVTLLCAGSIAGLHRPWGIDGMTGDGPAPERPAASVADAVSGSTGPHLQDLHEGIARPRLVQWSVAVPDEQDMASLQAQSSDSLQGMTWTLPRGVQAIHLREGQAQIIEEPDQWRVVAGPVRRLAVHWQQPRS